MACMYNNYYCMSSDWSYYLYHSSIDVHHCCNTVTLLCYFKPGVRGMVNTNSVAAVRVDWQSSAYAGNCRDDRLCIFIDWFKAGSKALDKAIYFWQSPVMFSIVNILDPMETAHLHFDKSTWAKSSHSYQGLICFNLNLSLDGLCMASKYLIVLNINWVFNLYSIQIYQFGCYLHAAVDIN